MTRFSLPLLLALATLHGIVAPVDAAAILRNRAEDDDGAHFRDAFWSPEPASPSTSGPPSSPEPGPSEKGKGKAAETSPGDVLIRKYEVPGREMYNDWLMADTAAAAGQLMSQQEALGPDPLKRNWARILPMESPVANAWSISDTTPALVNSNLVGLGDIVKSLGVGNGDYQRPWQKVRNANTLVYDGNDINTKGANVRIEMIQDQAFRKANARTAGDPLLEPLGGGYETVFNLIDGIIIVQENTDPAKHWQSSNPGKSLPHVSRPRVYTWSDMTWYHWMRMRGNAGEGTSRCAPEDRLLGLPFKTSAEGNASPFESVEPHVSAHQLVGAGKSTTTMQAFLNYIVITDIADQDTLSVIERCQSIHGASEVYPIGHWCFYALLGTDSSNMIAEFLAQHRNERFLGHKVLWSVTIQRADAAHNLQPVLIWHVVEANLNIQRSKMSRCERAWLPAADQRGQYGYPRIGSDC